MPWIRCYDCTRRVHTENDPNILKDGNCTTCRCKIDRGIDPSIPQGTAELAHEGFCDKCKTAVVRFSNDNGNYMHEDDIDWYCANTKCLRHNGTREKRGSIPCWIIEIKKGERS